MDYEKNWWILPKSNGFIEENYRRRKANDFSYTTNGLVKHTSGNLISYPSGTVYVENVVADAGIYGDNLNVLHTDLPIKEVEKVSKVDFTTGVETELDVSQCVIAEDKLSFTHPSLVDGDIVFFTYYYDLESTLGETTIEYYDSRHTIKDDVTGKFYKIVPKISDGVLTNELVEV